MTANLKKVFWCVAALSMAFDIYNYGFDSGQTAASHKEQSFLDGLDKIKGGEIHLGPGSRIEGLNFEGNVEVYLSCDTEVSYSWLVGDVPKILHEDNPLCEKLKQMEKTK